MRLITVVGAQFGSEAKGHVTSRLVKRELRIGRTVLNTRVAGPNAGHSVADRNGRIWALRQVPVGVVEPSGVALAIAPGSEVDPNVLLSEIDQLRAAGLMWHGRLSVDAEATVLTEAHIVAETGMHERIGSTGKGIGAARAERIMRLAHRVVDDLWLMEELRKRGVYVRDTTWTAGYDSVIIEGTQGYGLGLHAGHYPKCTSSDTRAIDFMAMAGISPWDVAVRDLEVWAVARVYPIRVAGASGALKDETTWEELGLEPERTTVTKKIRRVGGWDPDLVRKAVKANGGAPVCRIALTMLDQKFPHMACVQDPSRVKAEEEVHLFIKQVEADAEAKVGMVTTGPAQGAFL